MRKSILRLIDFLESLDRRIIYVLIAVSLSLPLILKVTLTPARMPTADAFYKEIEKLQPEEGKIVFVAADWGPNTQGENMPQTEVAIEHLMRKRIPFAITSVYALAAPFLENLPKNIAAKLSKESPGENWEYGKDWVNLGFRPSAALMIQGLSKTDDVPRYLKTDAYGADLSTLPAMKSVKTIRDIKLLIQVTGLVGTLSTWLQFFQGEDYRPGFLHGCTSITIPEAFIYYSSKQLLGLFEGLAGAAWYDKLLKDNFPKREAGEALLINTSLAYSHLIIIGLIVLGNVCLFLKYILRDK